MDANRRTNQESGALAATDAERERMEAAMQAGWQFRFDPVRMEYTAARELHTDRKLTALLDKIKAPK